MPCQGGIGAGKAVAVGRPPRSDWVYFAGICLVALLLRIPIAAIPLERDEGGYAYIAQRWMQGGIPYRDGFEKKTPAVYAVYLLIERGIGTSPAAIHWGMQLYTLGTLAVIFVLGRWLCSPTAGLAAAAFAAFMTTDPSVLGNAANTEMFMILPLTAAMLAAVVAVERGALMWVFVSGLLGGCALVFKQVALSNVVFYGLFVVWALRRQRLVPPLLVLGLVTIPLLTGAYFAAHGAWSEFFDATLGHTFAYVNRVPLASYPESLWRTLPSLLRSFWPLVLLAAVPVAAAVVRPGTPDARGIRRRTWLVLGWLAASFAGTASGGYFRPHYYVQLIPPLAVLAGMAVGRLRERMPDGYLRRAGTVALVAVPLAIGVLSNLWYYAPGDADAKSLRLYGGPFFAQSPAVGAFIADRSDAEDSVFVLGSEPQILYYAGRRSATRYIFVHPITGPFPDARQRQQEVLREIQAKQPRFILTVFLPSSFAAGPDTPPEIFDGTRELIGQSYRLAAVLADSASAVTPLLSGEPAAAAWFASPAWYGGPTWCALAVWERVPSADSGNRAAAELENRAGLGRAAQGDIDAAVAYYREAVRLDPDFGAAHNNLAASLAKSGQIDAAIVQYADAIRLAPLHAQPHWNLAVVLQEAGRVPDAIEQFRAAVQLDPQRAELRYRLATTYMQAGQVREAETELSEVLRQRPDSVAAAVRLSWLLATAADGALRNGGLAVQLAEDAVRRTQRHDPNALNSLAAAYAEVGRYPEAAETAAQAVESARGSGRAGLADAITDRLARYRAGQPFREPPGAPAP